MERTRSGNGVSTASQRLNRPTMNRLLARLAGSHRLEILEALAMSERTVGELVFLLDLDISSISHNLRILRDMELVEAESIQRERHYRLSPLVTAVNTDEWLELRISLQDAASVIIRLTRG